jgi:hypothetical protein
MTFTTSKGHIVNSDYSDEEVAQRLKNLNSDFAQSLIKSYIKVGWTDKQRAWAHKLVQDKEDKSKRNKIEFDVQSIIKRFDMASQSIQYPKVRIMFNDREYIFSRAGKKSNHPGSVYLIRAERNKLVARLERDNFISTWKGFDDIDKEAIEEFNTNALGNVLAYGRTTGRCSCCGRTLTNKKSIELGIGPICRERYGL